ncbi:hypothetical protein MXB_5132 [Myxobolus squamalis]|nr:hypothetical protein MXB_5132 [Myxobolus squamalis]
MIKLIRKDDKDFIANIIIKFRRFPSVSLNITSNILWKISQISHARVKLMKKTTFLEPLILSYSKNPLLYQLK